ncbi:MAG: hypothetical protein H5T69_02585 [Chloroflexi bacterium]|nr:hypothetical protein [Chloroflexota bacterium]
MDRVVIESRVTCPPPSWALWERFLIDKMNEAAPVYQERYTRKDGTFVWRQEWPGFDGSDDGYESYHNWPLFYVLGGSADIHERSRHAWEAVTRQFTEYGQVWREFDAHYDWMHHGESSIYFYYFGLADPNRLRDRARTLRFASFYMGEDEEADNWDAKRRMIRSPINGSRGPRLENQWDDWATHRAVLAHYPAPFEDIPGVEGPIADWNDDATYAKILKLLNERMMRCDVPLNLTSTSLVTTAFLYTGEPKYRHWVLDYLEAWNERIQANGGICPDNVGPNGIIGETMDGKWWGGYYGWRWPHGFNTIIQPLTIAAMNAVLLTGDMGYLDIPRSQLDRIMDLGRIEDGQLLIPNRHLDRGWSDFRPIKPEYPIQIWNMSQAEIDQMRLDRIPQQESTWNEVHPGRGKGDDIHIAPWYRWVQGKNPDYPRRILEAQWAEVARRMAIMAHDDGDPEDWDVHHWQNINPVHTEALVQLTCGGPQIIYHGGLLHVRLRYYDLDARRPGLPPDVGALVDKLGDQCARVTLVNTSPLRPRRLILQAGAFGEHTITQARDLAAGEESRPIEVNDKYLQVNLAPGGMVQLELGMQRYNRTPGYEQPL